MRKLFVLSLCLLTAIANASTTKVGNADDGGDLEGGKPITSGIIFETRKEALLALKVLNIQGVAGLGNLIPELQHGDLIMAKSDVHPLENDGEWERSEDMHTVYARTFPEPHAPTRFFPAALKLSRDQLVALHTHEALHRALPPGVRENEDKVAYLTMAITSSSANFDRISRVTASVLSQPPMPAQSVAVNSSPNPVAEEPVRPRKRTDFTLQHTTSSGGFMGQGHRFVNKMAFEFSPVGVRRMFGKEYEPRIEGGIFYDSYSTDSHVGPLSATATAPFYISNEFSAGPLFQFNLKSPDAGSDSMNSRDRDVYSIGLATDWQLADTYTTVKATYTLPSSFTPQKPDGVHQDQRIPPIWSVWVHEGLKLGRFMLGGIAELHHTEGLYENAVTTIVRTGPELKWSNSRTSFNLAMVFLVNRRGFSLDALGDLAGHGSGETSVSAGFARNF